MPSVHHRVGQIVEHPVKKEWGRGRVEASDGSRVLVRWSGLIEEAKWMHVKTVPLAIAEDQADPFEGRRVTVRVKSAKKESLSTSVSSIGVDGNINVFFTRLRGGFNDPKYIGDMDNGEGTYKRAAARRCRELILDQRPFDLSSDDVVLNLADSALRIVSKSKNLLFTTEAIAFNEALKDVDASRCYFSALFAMLDSPTPEASTFEPYLKAIESLPSREGGTSPEKWTVATLLPYLAQPDKHFFVKPKYTRMAAKSMGFPLNLTSQLNWPAYRQCLDMASKLLDELKPRGAVDMIDVQSFIWVTQYPGYASAVPVEE